MPTPSANSRFDLSGLTALVTGGSRGIGRGIALGLAEHGADIAIVHHGLESETAEVISEIESLGRRAWAMPQDLSEVSQLNEFVARFWDVAGGFDILVNNAGVAYLHHFSEVTWEQWQEVMNVNLSAVFFLSQGVAQRMIQTGRKGRIINISSKNGFVAEAGLAPYNASKGGVELLTQSLAIELGAYGITVNTIAPGMIQTEIAGDFEIDPEFFSYYKDHIPLENRFGTVQECVGAAIFLASSASSYMTGQHLIVDGGVLCEQVPRMRFMLPARPNIA